MVSVRHEELATLWYPLLALVVRPTSALASSSVDVLRGPLSLALGLSCNQARITEVYDGQKHCGAVASSGCI